ncbi:hypothetical protein BC938DRAFT_481527 [Jimgerdemannia flammicorona]|uniref:Uncharacterized protein n=1 Tax=Jimgerdemannia flammicorona TaxID=994334 RepID=A0A433QG10_9FUNG|nr:hypothetical protein BC938DRAFT_481527 [Jimgerdemannia flammicorona]
MIGPHTNNLSNLPLHLSNLPLHLSNLPLQVVIQRPKRRETDSAFQQRARFRLTRPLPRN